MYIALCRITIDIYEAASLKDKRNVVRSIKQRLRQEFNVSIAEVGNPDFITRGVLAAVSVANDPKYLAGQMQALLNALERYYPGYLHDHDLHVELADPDQE